MTCTNMHCELSFVPYDSRCLACSYKWFQDPELRALTNTPLITKEKQHEWFDALPSRNDYVIWGIEYGGVPIGACGLKKVTPSKAEYWGYIGEKPLWGHGLGKQIVSFCLQKAGKLGLKKVWLTVNSDNHRAIALYHRMGFVTTAQKETVLEMETPCVTSGVESCCMVNLPKISDPRGNLTFIEGNVHVPFDIKRVYYLYDVPGGSDRGGHAHKALHQLIVAISGSFDIVLDDGREKKRYHLDRSFHGLYVCPMIWRELTNFSSGSVCMVLASNLYDENDYYRDYEVFLAAANDAHTKLQSGRGRGVV